jgi:hypothetical protein
MACGWTWDELLGRSAYYERRKRYIERFAARTTNKPSIHLVHELTAYIAPHEQLGSRTEEIEAQTLAYQRPGRVHYQLR